MVHYNGSIVERVLSFTVLEDMDVDGNPLICVFMQSDDEWRWTGTEEQFLRLFANADVKPAGSNERRPSLRERFWRWSRKSSADANSPKSSLSGAQIPLPKATR